MMTCIEALWKRTQSDFRFACLWIFLIAFWGDSLVATAADKPQSVADGELRACQVVSVDSAWAVGDRGLILSTNDAGKHWEIQHHRSDAIHYGVCFSDELTGYVVGGTIDPYSHRSSGVVLTTIDGGKTWEHVPNELPRLTGVQLIEPGHLLAWGDWSDYYQSALFESMDGGQTFSGRPIPCGHIQGAAIGLDGVLVLVDRAGKIHRSENGLEFDTVNLPTTPFEPIRFCKVVDGVWWLGGEAGKLFRSQNSRVWEQLELPGTAEDRSLYSLADITGAGKRIWVVGQPGNVIWSSTDLGNTWEVLATANRTAIHSVSVLNGDLLLTCGTMANLFASRNGGKAWWSQHQSGTRNAVLNISSTHSGVAWDFMAHVIHDAKRHASAIVLHDQHFDERTGQLPELAARFEIAGKTVGLAQARVMASMPVSNLYAGIRQNDLGYYPSQTNPNKSDSIALVETTPLIKRIVFEIRNARPDVVVTNCNVTGTALEMRTALAVDKAVSLAGRRDFKVFSSSSRIPEEAWEPQRTVIRGANAGVQYAPSVMLDSNEVLGSVINRIKPLMETRGTVSLPDKRYNYRNLGAKNGPTWTKPLEGLILDQATQLSERQKTSQRLPMVTATSLWFGWKQFVELDSGNPLTPDRVWDSKIKAAAKEVDPASISPVLLDMAISCRRSGDWNRWQAALEFLLERDSESPAAESAFWELMVHTGSIEVKRMIASQRQAIEQRNHDGLNSTAANLQQASPFAKAPSESNAVQPAAFSNSVRLLPIATDRDLSEFTRVLSKWPDAFANRRSDPRWGWLIASRYREMQQRKESANVSVNLGRSYADFWPTLSPYVLGWNPISKIEREMLNASTAPPQMVSKQSTSPSSKSARSVASLPWTSERPYLDGKADEAFWETAARVEIRDPWASPNARPTTIRFSRDDKFLYLFSEAPVSSTQRSKKEQKRDSIKADEDQIRLRIDLDRDYASWFELSWSASGNSSDALNDMPRWNPANWYLATRDEGNTWCTEIAVELEQLIAGGDTAVQNWANRAWAFNVIRVVPGTATLSQAPSISDRVSVDDWFLLDLSRVGGN